MRVDCFTGNVNFPRIGWQPLADDAAVLSEVMGEAGYYTGLIYGHSPMGGITRGFSEADFQSANGLQSRAHPVAPLLEEKGPTTMADANPQDQPKRSPHATLQRLPMNAARWTEGFWADRFKLCHDVILPKMKEALEHPENRACLSNFRVAAGLEEGEHRGTNWSDGDCYKWIEAMAHVYAITRDAELDREMDYWINLIAKSQGDDGYICTQVQLDPEKERWGQRTYHELYNMGHLMTAACVHQRAAGKGTFVAVATKLADYLYGLFLPRPKELAHFGWNPSNIMGLADLYRLTGAERYLELADVFVAMRGSEPWPRGHFGRVWHDDPHPGDQNQDRVPLREETQAEGHAVTATYLWCGAADVFAETGEQALMDSMERIWRNVVERKMYLTGAVGAYHHGVSARGDMVHEAFGRDYELPNGTAYNETCANIGNAMWNMRLLHITGDAKYADVMEQVLYNSALSPMDVDGTRFCYTNPLARRGEGAPMLSQDSPERWSEFGCYCCPPQVARTLAKVHEWAYSTSDDGLWLHLYSGSKLDVDLPGTGRLKLTQETDYPWDGEVKITIDEASGAAFALMLRIPGWADEAEITVNGQDASFAAQPGTYASLDREWQAGDEVVLTLPMRARLIQAHPEVEEAHNHVAAMYGPVVYCLESVDLPDGVPIYDVHIPRDIELTARCDPDVLGGVAVLEGEAKRIPSANWEGKLYQELPVAPAGTLPIRLIPYYAWLNRGRHAMRVWLPLA